MTGSDLDLVVLALSRMRHVLYIVERNVMRRRTPERVAMLYDLDDLSAWDTAQMAAFVKCGISFNSVCDRVTARVSDLLAEFSE